MSLSCSFAISLAVLLATIKSSASGFTIRRIESPVSTSDLETGDSSFLEVRHDLNTSKVELINGNKDQLEITTNASTATKTTRTINADNTLLTNQSDISINNTNKEYRNTSTNLITTQDSSNQHAVASTLIENIVVKDISDNLTLPTTVNISSKQTDDILLTTTAFSSEKLQNNTDKTTSSVTEKRSSSEIPVLTENRISSDTKRSFNTDSYEITTENINISETRNNFNNIHGLSTIYKYNSVTESFKKGHDVVTEHGYSLENQTRSNNKGVTTYNSVPNINKISNFTEYQHITDRPTSSNSSYVSIDDIVLELTSNSPDSDVVINTDPNVEVTKISAVTEESIKATLLDSHTGTSEVYSGNIIITTVPVNIETSQTETAKDETTIYASPSGVIYKIMDKNEASTPSDIIFTTAESRYATVVSPTDLQFNSTIQENIMKENASELKTETPTESQTHQYVTMYSKRGGYLDNNISSTNSIPGELTTITYDNGGYVNYTESLGAMYETEASDADGTDALEPKNSTAPHSQLVDDALKEELMIEKMIHETELMKMTARMLISSIGTTTPVTSRGTTTQEIITEDVLSVKPINTDMKSIYSHSFNSNYKPLKKLNILPTKQFNRDPDDNSWRNERISSLGIVFKAKNATKSFTEVLKNKTTELNNIVDKNDKNEMPDLRVRLEKIAEVRKSKKQKTGSHGDSAYNDYDERSTDAGNKPKEEIPSPTTSSPISHLHTTPYVLLSSFPKIDDKLNYIQKETFQIFKEEFSTPPPKPTKKMFRFSEYYDTGDDYDADYVTKIDLKKHSTKSKVGTIRSSLRDGVQESITSSPEIIRTDPKATVQYFPPTKSQSSTPISVVTQNVNIDVYDDQFKDKVNQFSYQTTTPQPVNQLPVATMVPPTSHAPQDHTHSVTKHNPDLNDSYLMNQPREDDTQGTFKATDGSINKASYVIKHYKDFIADAVKLAEEDHLPFTESPIEHIKISNTEQLRPHSEINTGDDDYYSTHFQKDIVHRFIDNFNQNIDKYKMEFPVLYNNSVIHRSANDNGQVAGASNTFVKRLYEIANPRPSYITKVKACAECESVRVVDLSPAYELHYYVPEQEEKEQIEPRHTAMPYRIRL